MCFLISSKCPFLLTFFLVFFLASLHFPSLPSANPFAIHYFIMISTVLSFRKNHQKESCDFFCILPFLPFPLSLPSFSFPFFFPLVLFPLVLSLFVFFLPYIIFSLSFPFHFSCEFLYSQSMILDYIRNTLY